jgi:hypothetical protein
MTATKRKDHPMKPTRHPVAHPKHPVPPTKAQPSKVTPKAPPPPPATPPHRGATPGTHAAWIDNLAAPARATPAKPTPTQRATPANAPAATALRNQVQAPGKGPGTQQPPALPAGRHKSAHRKAR